MLREQEHPTDVAGVDHVHALDVQIAPERAQLLDVRSSVQHHEPAGVSAQQRRRRALAVHRPGILRPADVRAGRECRSEAQHAPKPPHVAERFGQLVSALLERVFRHARRALPLRQSLGHCAKGAVARREGEGRGHERGARVLFPVARPGQQRVGEDAQVASLDARQEARVRSDEPAKLARSEPVPLEEVDRRVVEHHEVLVGHADLRDHLSRQDVHARLGARVRVERGARLRAWARRAEVAGDVASLFVEPERDLLVAVGFPLVVDPLHHGGVVRDVVSPALASASTHVRPSSCVGTTTITRPVVRVAMYSAAPYVLPAP